MSSDNNKENELEVDNYHVESKKIEKDYLEELLVLLTPLLLLLANMKPLTKAKIDIEVKNWLRANESSINALSAHVISQIKKVVNSIFGKDVVPATETEKYTKANDSLVNNIVEDMKNKFEELATLEQNYPMNEEIREDYVAGIARHVEDKTELFSTMSTISTMRTMMFDEAAKMGFTEYQWHTQRDSRVRPTHAYMDTRWVKFDKPPKETGYYHVGQDWNCRCFADKFR